MHHIQFLANMYSSEHSEFILSPLVDLLKNGLSACKGTGDGIESFPLCEYVTQSLFLKLTGAQEQKIKCICWDLATVDYEYRYEFLNNKNYGECSNWNSKNGVYNDLISAIQKIDISFIPSQIFDSVFLTRLLDKILQIYENSVLNVWLKRELCFYKANYSSIISARQIAQIKQPNSKTYPLFQSLLKDKFEEIVYKHRNRCAHNTLSYQINKPDFNVLAKDNYEYNSYFFRYAIIILIDSILMSLFNKYLSILPEKV